MAAMPHKKKGMDVKCWELQFAIEKLTPTYVPTVTVATIRLSPGDWTQIKGPVVQVARKM
ncbi:hypothetical protein ACLOJK_038108 [Asimina triloba]